MFTLGYHLMNTRSLVFVDVRKPLFTSHEGESYANEIAARFLNWSWLLIQS